MYLLLLSLSLICSIQAFPIYLTDDNFQKKTFIGKHIPIDKWVIGFCDDHCPNEMVYALEKFENKVAYSTGVVTLKESPWLWQHFKQGLFLFTQDNQFTRIQDEIYKFDVDFILQHEDQLYYRKIPQFYRKVEVDFFSKEMVQQDYFRQDFQVFVHIGLVILLIFLYLTTKDGISRLREKYNSKYKKI